MVSQTHVPVAELVALQRDVQRLMSRFGATGPAEAEETKPLLDVYMTDDEIVIRLEAPGMTAEDLQVAVIGGVVSLKGEIARDRLAPPEAYVLRESSWGRFERRVSLPEGVDASRVRATFSDGVLTVRLLSSRGPESRRVGVRTSGEGGQKPPEAHVSGGRPHLFHGASEAATEPELGGAATGPSGTGNEELPGPPQANPQPRGDQLRYAPAHILSQEEWIGQTSSEAESLEEAAEEDSGGGAPGSAPQATRTPGEAGTQPPPQGERMLDVAGPGGKRRRGLFRR